jgi:MraZ protein
MYFHGEYTYSMDGRGRLPLPPRFRDAFARGAVLTQGSPDACIRVYPRDTYDEQATLYTSEPPTRRKGRMIRRAFFARSFHADLDGQGRILVPGRLREFAGLGGNAVVVGAAECLEIWEPDRWSQENELVEEQLETMLESVEPKE